MMKNILVNTVRISLFMVTSIPLMGQTISGYNLYPQNTYSINPAYTGSEYGLHTQLHFKNQFSGISSTPRNLMFVMHSPVTEKLSLGGNITAGQAGVFKTTLGNVASSYRIQLNMDQQVTFGLSAGFIRQSLDMDQLSNTDLSDPTLDPSYSNKTYYKFGYGLVYNWKNLEVSLAFPNAVQQEKDLLGNYFTGMASYKIATADELLKITPSVLYRALPVTKDQLDLYLKGQWKDLVWGLAGYRTNNNLIAGAGIMIGDMNVGYAYEAPTGTRDLSRGTHEVVIAYTFNKKKPVVVKPDTTVHYIHTLEAEVAFLKQQAGERSIEKVADSLRLTSDAIYSYDKNEKFVKIYPGNYVVIQNCSSSEFANRLVATYKAKGINTFKLYNQTQRIFYIVEKYFPNFDDAKFEMEKMRQKGYRNAWVMVH